MSRTRVSLLAFAARTWPMLAPAALVIGVTVAGSTLGDEVLHRVLIGALINLVLVVGLYIFVGNTGVFSFGQMSFMAIGAYTAALLTIPAAATGLVFTDFPGFLAGSRLPSIPATLVAGVVAAAVGFFLSIPLARLNGIAASLALFGVLVIIRVVAGNWEKVTGGTAGMSGVPTTTTAKSALVWTLLVIGVAFAFQQSRVGLRLRASREDEAAARAVGVNVFNQRRVAFALSAFVVGVGGALYGQFVGSFNPEAFYLNITFLTIAMLVVGGVNSLSGAVVGSLGISAVAELLRRLEQGFHLGVVAVPGRVGLQQVGLAAIMLVVLLVRPHGLTNGREMTWPFGHYGGRRVGSRSTRDAPSAELGPSPAVKGGASPKL